MIRRTLIAAATTAALPPVVSPGFQNMTLSANDLSLWARAPVSSSTT